MVIYISMYFLKLEKQKINIHRKREIIESVVHDLTVELEGSISAEHGRPT